MSLQVWLPLTKDLRNQGLNNVSATNNGATYSSTGGKLGGCYNFTTSSYQKIGFPYSLANYTEFTVCVWVKPISTTITGCLFTFVNPNDYWQFVITNGNNVGIRDSSTGETGSRKEYTLGSFVANTWTHLAISYNKGVIKIYKDGVLFSTNNTGGSSMNNYSGTNAAIGESMVSSSSYYFAGSVNDFRVYDHCLSPMEVKEISKGLILHYPLSRNSWGQNNILLNTNFDYTYTQTAWNTTKNGTLLANSWGGYNSGVANASTVYHAHLKKLDGEYVYEYIRTADESWLGISQSGLNTKLVAGKTYTFSWEQYCSSGNNYVGTGLYYTKQGETSANFHLGLVYGNTNRVLNKWQKFTYTFVAPSNADYSKYMSWYIYGHYGGNGTMYMRRPKLEEGTIATSWAPATADTLYTTLNLNGTTEYDCSGLCNNGIKNNLPTYPSGTAKYNVSTYLDGVNQTIQLPNLSTLIQDGVFTFSVWFKKETDKWSSKSWETIFGGPSGFEFQSKSGSTNSPLLYAYSWGKGTKVYTLDEWHHFVMVRTTEGTTFYLDGEQAFTGTAGSIPSGNYFLGSWSTTSSQNYKGFMGDARIYATAFSADDVLALYNKKI